MQNNLKKQAPEPAVLIAVSLLERVDRNSILKVLEMAISLISLKRTVLKGPQTRQLAIELKRHFPSPRAHWQLAMRFFCASFY